MSEYANPALNVLRKLVHNHDPTVLLQRIGDRRQIDFVPPIVREYDRVLGHEFHVSVDLSNLVACCVLIQAKK